MLASSIMILDGRDPMMNPFRAQPGRCGNVYNKKCSIFSNSTEDMMINMMMMKTQQLQFKFSDDVME